MSELLRGTVQSGKGDASHWLHIFKDAYERKLQSPIVPGSLNLALAGPFDWFASRYQSSLISFGREEYGGERDILFLPCKLTDLNGLPAWLWTTTSAAHHRPDPHVIEIVCGTYLRDAYKLGDGDSVLVELSTASRLGA